MSQSASSGNSSPPLLFASLDNVRRLSNLLRAIQFKEKANCYISEKGLRFTVEEAGCLQANAFIQSELFQRFEVQGKAELAVNLNILLECLNIFGGKDGGSTSAFRLTYQGLGSPFVLLLAEHGMCTDCSIKTMEADLLLDMNFRGVEVTNKLIMKSEWLKPSFAELDLTSDTLDILISPDYPYFRMSTTGSAGTSNFDYPKDSEIVEAFDSKKTQSSRYRLALVRQSVKALTLSAKVSMRMNARGFLSMQFMIESDDGQVSFVEYV
eukprot:Ihof_evm1s525 gene=Ihof_evmTU1s525